MKYEVFTIKNKKLIPLTTVDVDTPDQAIDFVTEQIGMSYFWGIYSRKIKGDINKVELLARPQETTEYKPQQLN